MFFRRVRNQLADQNWLAVVIDLFIVTVGIFLGIQASNWNDDRAERALERGYLIRLYEDILASAEGLEADNRFLEQQLSDQAIILHALDSCQLASEDELGMQRGISTLGYLNAPRLFRRTFDELAASGQIDVIRNEKIKAELARIVAEVEFRQSVMGSIFRKVDYHRARFDEQVRYDITRSLEGSTSAVAVNFDLQSLCELPRNAAAVSAISLMSRERLIAFRRLLDQYQNFLPLVRNELESRWGYVVERE